MAISIYFRHNRGQNVEDWQVGDPIPFASLSEVANVRHVCVYGPEALIFRGAMNDNEVRHFLGTEAALVCVALFHATKGGQSARKAETADKKT